MAKTTIDLSGRGGLAPGFAGDLNDIVSTPNLRYLGGSSQMADGIYDPLRVMGYMAPANNTYADLTGTITNEFVARAYDSRNDIAYFAQNGSALSTVSGLDGTSIASVTQIGGTFRDIELYEMNGEPALYYIYDAASTANSDPNVNVGYRSLDTTRGMFPLSAQVFALGVSSTDENVWASGNEKLAQMFQTQNFATGNVTVTGVRLRLRQFTGGVTQVWTLSARLETDNGSGRPSGTLTDSNAIATFNPANLPEQYGYIYLQFAAPILLTPNSKYHLVVGPTLFTDLSGFEGFSWLRSDNTAGVYPSGQAEQFISAAWANADTTDEAFDFALIENTYNSLVGPSGLGDTLNKLDTPSATYAFLQKADNGLLYIFMDYLVHKFDGGISGGDIGSFTKGVLQFPTFLKCVDAVDTNSLMYIAIQSSELNTGSDYRTFDADTMGVYQWDRQSTAVNTRNFIPIYGAREIRKIFVTPDGDLRVITIGENRFTEIRGIVNGKLQVLYRLGLGSYPAKRDSVDVLNNLVIWLGVDGITYALGKLGPADSEAVYKIGTITGEVSGTLSSGIIMVGNRETTQSREGVFISWKDSTKTLTKWYPHGTGTINSVAQKANIGKVYSIVSQLPYLCNVNHVMITCVPNGASGDTTVVAVVNFYKNMSATPFMTKNLTRNDIAKGYLSYEINKQYVNALQIDIEWSTTQTLGANDFLPAFAVLDYTVTNTLK